MFIIVIPQKELNCFDFHQKSFKIKFQKIILQYFVKKKNPIQILKCTKIIIYLKVY